MSAPDKPSFVAGMAAKYSGRLRRFLRLNLPNASDVPDLAQEVFMRLLRVPNHQDIRSPEAYLFTVASHVVQQHAQRQVPAPESLDILEGFVDPRWVSPDDPTAKIELQERLSRLERILDELPPRVAMALVMHRLAGLSIAEIAQELGVAQITVKKYLARALLHCRNKEAP